MRALPTRPGGLPPGPDEPGPASRPLRALAAGTLVLTVLTFGPGPVLSGPAEASASEGAHDELAVLAGHLAFGGLASADLLPGRVLVLASWQCSFLQLERANELARMVVEEPLNRLMEQGRLVGWGQLNGDFRAEFNYHTYYLADTMSQYRTALGQVLTHISRERQSEMEEFYRLCSNTRETAVTVVTARSRDVPVR
jgi:hypothetical protein